MPVGVPAERKCGMGAQFQQAQATFAERYAAAKENATKPFGGDKVPAGTYAGRIKSYRMEKAKTSGRNQLRVEIVIADGDSKGLVARQFQGLDPLEDGRQIGLEIFLRQIAFFGYEVPEAAQSLVDLEPICKAVEDSAPEVQFKWTMKGDFGNIELQKLLGEAREQATDETGGGEGQTGNDVDPQGVGSGFEDADHERLVEFGLAQGIAEIVDGMSKAEVIAAINGYTLWTQDCAATDLKGTDADGQKPADGITPEDADWIIAQGVSAKTVVRPKPKAAVKAPAKAAVKSVVKKRK